jgi:hypothetical protein
MANTEKRKGVTPYAQCLVVCDLVIREANTGKHSLIGIFSHIGAQRFPAVHPRLSVYLALSDGVGEVPIRLAIVDARDSNRRLVQAETVVRLQDARTVAEAAIEFPNIVFPEAADYRVQLYADDTLLMERRLMVADMNPPSAPGG